MATSKTTDRSIRIARQHLALGQRYAYAASLSALHRCSGTKVQREIEGVIAEDRAGELFGRRNGCLIAAEA